MATIVHGNLTVADVVVIVCYILGVIAVGVWVSQILFLTYFLPIFYFMPPENARKPKVFWCFYEV